jgi:hypothetical protein
MAQGIHTIDSRNVDVKRAVPKDKMAPSGGGVGHPNVPESKKIFVGGLAPEVTEKEFKEYFEQFGPIQVSIYAYASMCLLFLVASILVCLICHVGLDCYVR